MASSSSSNHLKRSSKLTDFYPTTKKQKSNTHKRTSSSNKYPTFHNRTSSLPTNWTTFSKKGYFYRSIIPKGLKTNIWSRKYSQIPNNKKYNPYNMSSAATGAGHVKAAQEKKEGPDDPKHYYETRLARPVKGKRNPYWVRSKILLSMIEESSWPCYTANISSLAFATLSTHYFENVGYRHKSIINLIKSTTTLIYETRSDQPWSCRAIVWTHDKYKCYNRASSLDGTADNLQEYELLPFPGKMEYDTTGTKAVFTWTEKYLSADQTETETQHTFDDLLEPPLNTKYPSTPFYWAPSSQVGIIYDNVSIIPGKEHHLASSMFIEDTWQKLPGLVQYKDTITRGGITTETSAEIRYSKNTYLTLIWQPGGVHSGSPLPLVNKTAHLKLDIIHTLYWSQ